MKLQPTTQGYTKLQNRPLTAAQLNAVDLLACGTSDTDVAAALGLNRVTVTRWRLYHPGVMAAVNARRADVWAGSLDRLRALVPAAVDVLAAELAGAGPNRLKAAVALLKLVPPVASADAAPTDAAGVVKRMVFADAVAWRAEFDATTHGSFILTSFEDCVAQKWDDLAAEVDSAPAGDESAAA